MHQAPVRHAAWRVRRGSPRNPRDCYVLASIAESLTHGGRSTRRGSRTTARGADLDAVGPPTSDHGPRFALYVSRRKGRAGRGMIYSQKKTRHEGGLDGRGGLVHLLPLVCVSGCGVGKLRQLHKVINDHFS